MSLVKEELNTLGAKSFADTAVRYPIGVAARLTGIQVETLRVWERRYGVIGPQVSASGRRLYAAEDLERLRLIKQLVDSGHPISSVASVPSEKLRELREVSMERIGKASEESAEMLNLRAVLVGEAQRAGRGRGLVVAGYCVDMEKAVTQFRNTEADVVIVELPSLLDLDIEEIDNRQRIVSVSPVDGRVAEYELTTEVSFDYDVKGASQLQNETLKISRNYSFDNTERLGAEQEQSELLTSMHEELAHLILLRVATANDRLER